jgi:predicted oxidoreductase
VPTKKNSAEFSPQINTPIAPAEVVIGTLVAIDNNGRPCVRFCLGNSTIENLAALSTQIIDANSIGRQVALLFAGGNQQQPVIMGFIHSPLDLILNQSMPEPGDTSEIDIFPTPVQYVAAERSAALDGKRLVFEAEEEVQIKCGEASINLYKDGRVVIRGKNLISRASVVNRILGGSVQVN